MDTLIAGWAVSSTMHAGAGERRVDLLMACHRIGRNVCFMGGGGSAPAPDPNIGIAARENADLSKEMAGVAREELAFAREQWTEAKPVYNEVIQSQLGQMRTDAGRATEQWELYKNLFQPVEQKLVQDAMAYDSPERKERMAAAAAADVSSSHDAAGALVKRNMQSMGVNPNDPKFAAVMSQAGLARARDTAGAMNMARNNTELTGMSMRQGAAQFGRNMPATSIAQDAATLNAGNSATGTINNQAASRTGQVAAASPWYSGAVGANTQAGNLYANQSAQTFNAWNVNNQNKQQSQAGTMQGIGTMAGIAAMFMKDGGLVRRKVEEAQGSFTAGTEPIEGEYNEVDQADIDPTDGELLEAIGSGGGLRRDINYAGMPRRREPAGMTPDGMVDGPGTTTSDSVPARLSKKEAVLNAEATAMLGEDFINRVNREGLKRRRAVAADGVYKYEGVEA